MTHPMPSDRDTAPAAVEVSEAAWKVVKDTIAELQQLSQRTDGYASGYAWQGVIVKHLLAARSTAEVERDAFQYERDSLDSAITDARKILIEAGFDLPFLDDTVRAVVVRVSAAEDRVKVLEEALTEGRAWHEASRKAIMKQPASADGLWRRHQHDEQIEALSAALSQNRTEGGTDGE